MSEEEGGREEEGEKVRKILTVGEDVYICVKRIKLFPKTIII